MPRNLQTTRVLDIEKGCLFSPDMVAIFPRTLKQPPTKASVFYQHFFSQSGQTRALLRVLLPSPKGNWLFCTILWGKAPKAETTPTLILNTPKKGPPLHH